MLDRKNKPRGGTKHYSFTGKDDPTLPSIACFTMLNSGDSLTSMDVSSDGAVIAGGYSDNVARLWRLDGEKILGKKMVYGTIKIPLIIIVAMLRYQKANRMKHMHV